MSFWDKLKQNVSQINDSLQTNIPSLKIMILLMPQWQYVH